MSSSGKMTADEIFLRDMMVWFNELELFNGQMSDPFWAACAGGANGCNSGHTRPTVIYQSTRTVNLVKISDDLLEKLFVFSFKYAHLFSYFYISCFSLVQCNGISKIPLCNDTASATWC